MTSQRCQVTTGPAGTDSHHIHSCQESAHDGVIHFCACGATWALDADVAPLAEQIRAEATR